MDISEVVKETGIPSSTLRYYEKVGLIASSGRKGLKRVYPAGILERLALIALAQSAGFSLQEIHLMLPENGRLEVDRKLLLKKARELDRTIRRLTAMRDGLKHASACSAPSHMECPKFRTLMDKAIARPIKNRG